MCARNTHRTHDFRIAKVYSLKLFDVACSNILLKTSCFAGSTNVNIVNYNFKSSNRRELKHRRGYFFKTPPLRNSIVSDSHEGATIVEQLHGERRISTEEKVRAR